MDFWRNESTSNFNPSRTGWLRLNRAMDSYRTTDEIMIPQAMDILFATMPQFLHKKAIQNPQDHWWVQEFSKGPHIFKASFVVQGTQKSILNTIVGGGFSLWMESNGHLTTDLSVYYHRLVCTNGMIRQIRGEACFEAFTLQEWRGQLEKSLPLVLDGISTGLDTLYRSAQVRLGLLRPLIPVILDYLAVRAPLRELILTAFAQEPGDTLWHFINAFSRAANDVMLAQGISREEALRKRYQLQQASIRICETVLEEFTKGTSLFDMAAKLKGVVGRSSAKTVVTLAATH